MSDNRHPFLGPWHLMPAAPGTCPECAVDHPPAQPHNRQSLAYQYYFYGRNGRWPTWTDAMAHCDEQTKTLWSAELIAVGESLD